MRVRPIELHDAQRVCDIYNQYVRESIATFEETEVEVAEMRRRIAKVTTQHPWLVSEHDGHLSGYAYASHWRGRSAFRHTVEVSVYVDHTTTRRGIGYSLYDTLLPMLKDAKIHVAIAAIALPNESSLALHRRFGFKPVGIMTEVGFKLGRWVDVAYWQLSLPR